MLKAIMLIACLLISYHVAVAQTMMSENEEGLKGPGVRLHRPDGTVVYVNAKAVAFVRAPLATETGKATVVFTGGVTQSVQEEVEEVIKLIAAELEEY
jgi:hypothetical protein